MAEIKVKIYNQLGEEVGTENLPAKLFGVKVNPLLVQQAVVAQRANSRSTISHTKTRGEVRGGGRKPWKQKGTGRARHGSIRSPLWVGGGITFGPRSNRNFSLDINKKMKKKALAMVLTDKVSENRLVLLDNLNLAEGKTKLVTGMLNKLPCGKRKTLIVTDKQDDLLIRATKNIAYARTIAVNSLNVNDLMSFRYLVIPQRLLSNIISLYS